MNKNYLKLSNLFRGYGMLKETSLYPRVNLKILKELEELDMSEFFRLTGDYKYMWVDENIYNELKNHMLNGGYIFIECPYQNPIKLKVVEE